MKNQKILDQKGVAPVLELILVVVLVGVLGFAGYRAYQSRQDEAAPAATTVIPAGWTEYSAFKETGYDVTFAYPSSWKKEVGGKPQVDDEGKKFVEPSILTFTSSDFDINDADPGRQVVANGVQLKVAATGNSEKKTVDDKRLTELKDASKAFGGSYGTFTTVGGYKGTWFEPLNGGEAYGYHVHIFTEQHIYEFLFYTGEKTSFKADLEKFLKTIKISNPEKLTQ